MIDFFQRKPRTGIVAPRIVFPDNRLHPSARRFITFLGAISDVFQIHFYFPNNPLAKRFDYNNWKHDKLREVDWVTGAAFMTERDIFKSSGMLDERFFMYFEDMDFCMSVVKNGYKIFFSPDFSVVHYHAKGGSDKLPVRSVDYYISLFRYLLKHQGFLKAWLFRLAMISWGCMSLLKKITTYFFSQKTYSIREHVDVPLRLILFKSYET
jgi:GT2 family glycosyltransferase